MPVSLADWFQATGAFTDLAVPGIVSRGRGYESEGLGQIGDTTQGVVGPLK